MQQAVFCRSIYLLTFSFAAWCPTGSFSRGFLCCCPELHVALADIGGVRRPTAWLQHRFRRVLSSQGNSGGQLIIVSAPTRGWLTSAV